MTDRPSVTVVDPGDPGRRQDVLSWGEGSGPRWSRRSKLVRASVAVGVLAVATAGVAVPRALDARAEQRARAEAFATADAVHLTVSTPVVSGFAGQLSVQFVLGDDGMLPPGERLVRAVVQGEGVRPVDPDVPLAYASVPAEVFVGADVDCVAVAAGRYPEDVALVTTVRPLTRVAREQRTPLDRAVLRRESLAACGLPDPDAQPVVEVQADARGQLVVFLEGVRNAPDGLTFEAVEVPGFTVLPIPGLGLPSTLPVDSGGLYAFTVRVTDCEVARGQRDVLVRLRTAGVAQTRVADTTQSQPQPGSEPAAALLERLIQRAC